MNEKLAQAMDHVGDGHIAEAAKRRKKKRLLWPMVAAALVVILILNLAGMPGKIQAQAISLASGSRLEKRPDRHDYDSYEEYSDVFDSWRAEVDSLEDTAGEALNAMMPFLLDASLELMGDSGGENRVWSPVNAYIALAMLAETTGGETQRQLLELLGAEDLDTLRSRVTALWETVYTDNGKEISVLANSLWLDERLTYDQGVMDNLSHHYFASVYQGDLGSAQTNKDIQTWLSNQTDGFLDSGTGNVELPADTILALASTVYFQSKWTDDFSRSQNTDGIFHTPDEDIDCTFMNAKERQMNYYWADSYGAVSLMLENGCNMWLILPDEDKTVDAVLTDGQYLEMVTTPYSDERSDCEYMQVNLSIPKFDVQAQTNLKESLMALGVTDVFGAEADFTPSMEGNSPVYVSSVEQGTRVAIDEDGVTAASYIVIVGAGGAMPAEEVIDFVVDRPFIFVITGETGLPLFTGVVNTP